MMDLRYHLASLMSVFLALAVGIVVGVSLGSSERQAATIQSLQRDVAAIRAEDSRLKELNSELRRLLTTREDIAEELLPLAIRGRLTGNRMALLLTGDAAVLASPAIRALRLAGAEIALTVQLPRGPTADGPTAGASNGTVVDPGEAGANSARNNEAIAAAICRSLLQGRGDLLDQIRARSPDLQITGELHSPVRRLLLLCPNDRPEYARRVAAGEGVEAAIVRTARAADAIVVAAEAEEGRLPRLSMADLRPQEPVSLLPALAALGATTVDHAETAGGQISLVLALSGAKGSFGTGPRANRPLPTLATP